MSDEQWHLDSGLNKSSPAKKAELQRLLGHCKAILEELEELLLKHKSLGTNRKKSWDRIKFGTSDIKNLKERLQSHTTSISIFLTSLGAKSIARIEDQLDQLAHEIRSGARESTIFIFEDSDKPVGTQLERLGSELQRGGISKEEVDTHQNGIQAYAQELAERYGLGVPLSPSCKLCISLLDIVVYVTCFGSTSCQSDAFVAAQLTGTVAVDHSGEASPGMLPPTLRQNQSRPPVPPQKPPRRLASVSQLSTSDVYGSDRPKEAPQNGVTNFRQARSRSISEGVSETFTDIQEYDDQGRLRKRTITRQNSGSSVGTTASAPMRMKSDPPKEMHRRSTSGEASSIISDRTSVPKLDKAPSVVISGKKQAITEQAQLPSLTNHTGVHIRYITGSFPDIIHPRKQYPQLTSPTLISSGTGRSTILALSRTLCRSAFAFAVKTRMPIFLRNEDKMIRGPFDRTWLQWVNLCIEVILDPRTRVCCERHKLHFVTTLNRASMLEPAEEYPDEEAHDYRKALQLVSAGLQVAFAFEDAKAVKELEDLYRSQQAHIALYENRTG